MRDLAGIVLSVALPWIAGALWVRAASNRSAPHGAGICIGYGYLVGLFGVTVVMRALNLVGQTWSLAWVALPIAVLALAAWLRARPLRLSESAAGARDALASLPSPLSALFLLLLLLTCTRTVLLGIEVMLSPLVPYDAFAQWASKSRVWYEYGRMAPFVRAAEWAAAEGTMHFTDTHPEYPGTVPLFHVWTALCVGRWDESLINLPWIAGFVSLGIAFYAQVRRLGVSALKSMFATYVLLSLPYLTIHVALAGIADLFVAIAYGLAAMALWQWTIGRRWEDALLAIAMSVICASLKMEGLIWVSTLAAGLVVALNRRAGLLMIVGVAAAGALYLAFGPEALRILNYTLGKRFVNVSASVYDHLFVMDNWHLLWYAAVAIVAVNAKHLASTVLAPMGATLLAGAAFIVVVYFFTNASTGVLDDSLTNRLPLQMVPALVFYLAAVLRERARQSADATRGAAVAA